MTTQERLGSFGNWTVTLSEQTPDDILEALKDHALGTIYITPSRIDPKKVHPKEVARYAGIYRKREFTDTTRAISGSSLLWLLGDGVGKGAGVDLTSIDLTGESFTDALTAAIADTDISVGTIVPEVGGLPSGNFFLQDARHKVEEITKQFGAEYKITPKAELDAGSPASLWPTFNDPVVFIKRGAKGVDPDWKPLPIASSAMGEDLINFATQKIIAADQDGTPVIQGQATIASSKRGPNGTLLEITSVSADSQVGQAAADSRAAALLALENAPRQTVSLSTDEFDIDGTVVVGDTVSVWNPEVGFFDINNHIIVQGEHYFPLNLRVFGATWPITEGMGVYLRPPTASGDDNIFDLSPYLVPESGSTDLEVGAAARRLVPAPTESLGPVIAPVVNPDAPPPLPDPPTIFGNERSILVQQPTTSGGSPLPLTVTKFDIYASTTSGFTPGPTNYIGYISVAKADITLGIDVLKSFKWEEGDQTYVRTAAVNTSGPGPASTEVAVTAGLIPSAAILNLAAEKIDAGTINVAIELNAAVINGGLIVGGIVQTAASGQRVALEEAEEDKIKLYTGDADEVVAGNMRSVIAGAGTTRQLNLISTPPRILGEAYSSQFALFSPSADLTTFPTSAEMRSFLNATGDLVSSVYVTPTTAAGWIGNPTTGKRWELGPGGVGVSFGATTEPALLLAATTAQLQRHSGGRAVFLDGSGANLQYASGGRRVRVGISDTQLIGSDNVLKFGVTDTAVDAWRSLDMHDWPIVSAVLELEGLSFSTKLRVGGSVEIKALSSDDVDWRDFGANIITAAAGGFVERSDERLKQDIQELDLDECMDLVRSTHPDSFELRNAPGKRHYGFVAQKVPTIARGRSEDLDGQSTENYNLSTMIGILWGATLRTDERLTALEREKE